MVKGTGPGARLSELLPACGAFSINLSFNFNIYKMRMMIINVSTYRISLKRNEAIYVQCSVTYLWSELKQRCSDRGRTRSEVGSEGVSRFSMSSALNSQHVGFPNPTGLFSSFPRMPTPSLFVVISSISRSDNILS